MSGSSPGSTATSGPGVRDRHFSRVAPLPQGRGATLFNRHEHFVILKIMLKKMRLEGKWRKLLLGVVIVIFAAAGLWYWLAQQYTPTNLVDAADIETVKELERLGIPQDKEAALNHFITLGTAYSEAQQHDKALAAFLKADTLITDRTIETGRSVSLSLASTYTSLGNKAKAAEYYNREIQRLRKDGTSDSLESVEALEQRMIREGIDQ